MLPILPSHTDWHWSSILGTAGKRSRGPQALGGHLGREARPRRLSGYCPLQVNTKSRTILEHNLHILKCSRCNITINITVI